MCLLVASIALSLAALLITWALLLVVSFAGGRRSRSEGSSS